MDAGTKTPTVCCHEACLSVDGHAVMTMSEPIDLAPWRENGSLVRINHTVLMHKLHLRGKTPHALRDEARVGWDTLAKIRRGEPVRARVLERITAQLVAWPELEHAADLLTPEPPNA